jgi:hypothetical protein
LTAAAERPIVGQTEIVTEGKTFGGYARFRHLAIERAKPEPTAAEFAAIELLLGARLPSSFRDFLRLANGGYLEYQIDVPVGDGRTEPLSFCDIFSAADIDEFGTLVGETRAARKNFGAPPGVLPFARDGGGSMVFLDLSPSGNGRVVAFVEGLPAWTGLRTESAFVELARTFDEYVDKLEIDREDAIEHLNTGVTELHHVEAMEAWFDIAIPRWREDLELSCAVKNARMRLRAG